MIAFIAAVVAGLLLLAWSADRFVEGAAALSHSLGLSTMIVGITVIGFGTSAPEILVSAVAVIEGTPNIAIGNALGSNIANIGLILGVTAILLPIPVVSRLFKVEYPLLLLATLAMAAALYDLRLGPLDGLVLIALLSFSLYYLVREHRRNPAAYALEDREREEMLPEMKPPVSILWLLLGLALLVASSELLVWGASNIAASLGVSELIIGLTIVALGTSLPELAASIASLRQGRPELAIGNVIGSNLFNSLAVIGLPATFIRFEIDPSVPERDLPVAVGLTLLLILMSRFPGALPRFLTRAKGLGLFTAFVIYQLSLYYEAAVG